MNLVIFSITGTVERGNFEIGPNFEPVRIELIKIPKKILIFVFLKKIVHENEALFLLYRLV